MFISIPKNAPKVA